MGLVIDTSVIVGFERAGMTAETVIEQLASFAAEERAVLSAIGLTEIVHGIYRSPTPAMFARRKAFLDELLLLLEVRPYTTSTALLAGQIDAEQRIIGLTVPFADLLIGATALEIGYSILTSNICHFGLIPNLIVIPFIPS